MSENERSQLPFISIVMPVYREGDHIAATLSEVKRVMDDVGLGFEFVLIDDGSPDDTWRVLTEQSMAFPMMRAARLSRNFGKESALSAGLEIAQGEAVIVMDADGQHPPALLPDMIRLWRNAEVDIVEGVKTHRGQETVFNRISAGVFYFLWNKVSGFELRGASDYKLLDRRAVDAYLAMPERHVFFRGMTAWLGFRVAQLPFEVAERVGGRSGWSLFKRLRLAVDGIAGFSSMPLRLVTMAGLLFLLFAVLFAIQTLFRQFSGHSVSGFPTVIFLLLIIGSFLMISLGVIGEYVAKIYDEVKGRPRYVIARKIGKDTSADVINEVGTDATGRK